MLLQPTTTFTFIIYLFCLCGFNYAILQFNQHRVLQPPLFDNSDLSNFIESFACDLSPQHYQTKYSTLSDTGKMNRANKPENLYIFILMCETWVKININ